MGMGMGMALLNINLLIRRSFPRTRKAVVSASITSFCTKAVVKPWLMLPPYGSVYDLYSVADDKVVSLNKGDHPELFKSSSDDYDAELIVGSSHGWIVYYINQYPRGGGSMFLSNPVSHQHIKLPKLPDSLNCANVMISSPRPDSDLNCRAVMKYSPGWLAFCCPACSTSNWTPFGNKRVSYCSCVYSARQKLFFCLTKDDQIEAWDLNDLNSPIMTPLNAPRFKESFHRFYPAHFDFMFNRCNDAEFGNFMFNRRNPTHFESNYDYNSSCDRRCFEKLDPSECLYLYNSSDRSWYKDLYPSRLYPSACLAVAEKSDDLYQVRRFTTFSAYDYDIYGVPKFADYDINGLSFSDFDINGLSMLYKTLHFDVYKYDRGLGEWEYMDAGTLDGMAFFVGINHGFALSAADYPHLKPNAIYFTDIKDFPIGGYHDVGIFNYRDRTISPCYYPCDKPSFKELLPPPFWITLQI